MHIINNDKGKHTKAKEGDEGSSQKQICWKRCGKKIEKWIDKDIIKVVAVVRRAGKSFFSLHALKEKNSDMLISMRKKSAMLNSMKF